MICYINKINVNVGGLYFRGVGIKLHFFLLYIYPDGFLPSHSVF